MLSITVNGKRVEVAKEATLLDAARLAGADVPTLCYLKETGALTSCMICVVKDVATGKLLPSCAAHVVDGMAIVTEDDEIREARRAVLSMLLNEHAGDCEAPCSLTCPAGLDIPRMLRYIAAGDADAAARLARRDLVFPATLGRVCSAPCERVCRRGQYDAPIGIRAAHASLPINSLQADVSGSGKTAAVVGAGLAGLAAAFTIVRLGHACHVYEKRLRACESLRARSELPREILDAEIETIRAAGVVIHLETDVAPESLLQRYDVAIAACNEHHESNPRIFDAEEESMYVRAVANGKRAAFEADAFLRKRPVQSAKPFNSSLGALAADELPHYAVERLRKAAASDVDRCLHCDCLKRVSCKLRQYATEYGLGPRIKRTIPRPFVKPIERSDAVVFEPGKCIKCGICVALTRAAGVRPGMTIAGRGFDACVRPALGATLAEGLGSAAEECVRACPTAALAFRDSEETS